MSEAELANTLTAVVGLPVAVADTHVIRSALPVARASIGALRGNVTHEANDNCYKKNQTRHLVLLLYLNVA